MNTMKKLYIALFLILLFIPPVVWTGLFVADRNLYESLDFDLGEKREKTQLESISDLALNGQAINDYFADRAPFRSILISFKKSFDSKIENPYEYNLKPLALKKFYGIEDAREKMAVDTIAMAGQKALFKSEKIKALFAEEEKSKEVAQSDAEEEIFKVIEEELPDCLNPGHRVTLNTVTGEEIEEELPAMGHDWQISSTIDPTYINFGYTEYICKVCGEEKIDDWTDKLVDTSYLAPNVHGDTTIGRFDWLFLYGWGNIPYYQADNLLSEEEMNLYVDRLNTLSALCEERGIKFAVLWAPSKDTVYPEYMPSFEVYDSYKRVPRLYDHIKANSSVKIAFPKAELKNITRYYDSYYRYDSHWNYVGSFIGVQAMYGLLGMPQTDIMSLEVTKESLPASGDLIILGGLNSSDYPSFYEYTVHYKDWIHTTWETEEPVLLNESIYKTEADCGNDTRFVMVGDSYRNYMVKYIKKDFDHCTFVHREHFLEAKDDILAANVLVLESAERYDYKSLADMENLIQLFSSTDQ